MKKILLFASALAGLFLAGSCQRENLEPQAGQQVTFTIEAPAAMQTKAIADGLNVDELIYEVWITDTDNQENLTTGATRLYQATTDMVQDGGRMKANITLDLVNDQNFTVLFWAQKKGINVYNTANLTGVTYTNKEANAYSANDNRLDAFYAKAYVVDCQTATPTVELRRPFAQVNLCTLNNKDAAQVNGNYNISLVSSKMRLDAVPTVFNVATSEATKYAAMEFAANTVPSGEDKMITVNGQEYFYAGMNYVFAGANIVLTYDIQTKLNGTVDANVNNKIQNVPLRENHRTNIVGNLLTSKTDFEIIVDAAFESNDLAPDPIYLAAANGGEVVLDDDLTLAQPLEINADMTLDLNGKTITGAMTVAEGADVTIENGKIVNGDKAVSGITTNGNLTLNNVEIESARHAVRVESGKVIINGGKYTIAPISNSTLHALNVGDNGTEAEVIIKGGEFFGPKGTMADSGSAVNVRSGSKVTIEGGDFSGGKKKTLASGGTLTVKGGSFDQDPTAFVAEGYIVVKEDGFYRVLSGVTIESKDAFETALSNPSVDAINLSTELEYNNTEAVIVEKDFTIYADGKTITAGGASSLTPSVAVMGDYDVVIDNANIVGGFVGAYYGAEVVVDGGSLKFTDGKSGRNCFYAASVDEKVSTITIKDVDVNMANASGNSYLCAHGNAIIYVEGGNFYGKPVGSSHPYIKEATLGSYTGEVIITGGTFNFDPSEWVAAGYKVVDNGNDTWSVVAE